MTEQCDIYCAEVSALSDPDTFGKALWRVPVDRRRKALAFRHRESQCLSLGVGLLLVLALEERGVDALRVRTAEGPWGKPCLPDHPEIQFSLSHSGTWAVCAVSGAAVGCDVERIGRGTERLAGRFFHPEEQAALARAGGEGDGAWQREFTRIWTRKESWLKATGTGISVPMAEFSALADGPGRRFFERESPEGAYRFACCLLTEEEAEVSWRRVEMNEGFFAEK